MSNLSDQQHLQIAPWRALLLRAADVIEEHGHCKMSLLNDSGALCVLGAINVADGAERTKESASDHVASLTARKAKDELRSSLRSSFISFWNNAPERTAADVIQKLREVATS